MLLPNMENALNYSFSISYKMSQRDLILDAGLSYLQLFFIYLKLNKLFHERHSVSSTVGRINLMRNHYRIGLVALLWYQMVWILKKQSVFPQKLKKEPKFKMLREL